VLAARRQNRPLVASYHTDIARYARHYRLAPTVPLIWSLLRSVHARAHLNLATSAAAADDLARHGIADVRLWPPGVDLDLFRPNGQLQDRAGSGRQPVALYVGRLAAEKGLHRLAPLADPASGVQLLLVGEGPARSELEHALPASVTFAGTLRGSELARAYRQANLFVFPSTTDTLGLVLLEALGSGLPVLAADSPASRETLAGCPAARLFPADQPGALLAGAQDLLARPPRALGEHARRHAEQAGWTAATDHLLARYDEAAKLATGSSGPFRTTGQPESSRCRPDSESGISAAPGPDE
jgi:glycosyltransferase involved in cell wall biosynthesis